MADDVFPSLPRLEDLCVKVVGANGSRWKPEHLLEIPRHLICPILKNFHPFDVERLEVSGVFQTLGIDTDPLWKVFYFETWRRKSKWPEIYFKTKGISKGREAWRVCYLQRRLQDALNSCHAPSKETSSPSAEGGQNIKNLVSICGRYASYLRLYNSACIFLAENLDIWLQLAEYLEFLEVFILRDNGVNPLCHLLQVLTSKRLKSLGFCFCKVSSVQMWNRIINSLSKPSHQKNATDIHEEEKNMISSTQKTTCDIFTSKGITKSNDFVKQTCDQMNCAQDIKSRSKETQVGQSDEILDDHIFVSTESDNCDSLDGTDDVDIYEFMDSTSALSDAQENTCTCISNTHTRQSDGCVVQSLDIYDEVFGHCKCGQKAEALKELSPLIINKQQKGNESSLQGRVSPGASKLGSPLPSFSNLSCSLVHFELVAFWLHHDLHALFVHALQGWLSLETLILEDNALGLVSTPGCEFIETLSYLCTKGRLQSLQLTNNPVNNEFAKLFFEKLIAAFCHKCSHNNNARSLTKLKFSSYQVSQVSLAYLGRAIRDACACNQSAAELLESASSRSSSKVQTQVGCSEQKCSCVSGGYCVTCESDHVFGSWKTNSVKMKKNSFDHRLHDTRETQVRAKMNVKPDLHILNQDQELVESSEDSSDDKKPLSFVINNSNSSMFTGIQVLKLRCVVGDEGARFIAHGLRRNSSLYSLSLANCNINPAGLADIFQAVSGNRYLKQLCVKGNRYDPGNNDSLAKMLTSNNTLSDLDLGTCDLRGLCEKVIHALCINNTLTSLKLSRNGLGDADISALSQVFSHPSRRSKLSKLDLSFNHISPESLSVLASSLQSIRPRKLDELKLTKKSVLSPEFHQVLLSLKSVVRNVTAEYLDHATLFADFISQM